VLLLKVLQLSPPKSPLLPLLQLLLLAALLNQLRLLLLLLLPLQARDLAPTELNPALLPASIALMQTPLACVPGDALFHKPLPLAQPAVTMPSLPLSSPPNVTSTSATHTSETCLVAGCRFDFATLERAQSVSDLRRMMMTLQIFSSLLSFKYSCSIPGFTVGFF
jgi:hypothetical protein